MKILVAQALGVYEEYVCEFQGRRESVERLSFEKKRFLKVKNYLSYIEMTRLEKAEWDGVFW